MNKRITLLMLILCYVVAWTSFIHLTTPEEKSELYKIQILETRQEIIEKQFSPWTGSHMQLEKLIINAMNDPNSYEHRETKYLDNGDHIVIFAKYSGKNMFGGTVTNTIKASAKINGNIIKIF